MQIRKWLLVAAGVLLSFGLVNTWILWGAPQEPIAQPGTSELGGGPALSIPDSTGPELDAKVYYLKKLPPSAVYERLRSIYGPDIKMVVDERTNSLVVEAPAELHEEIGGAIKFFERSGSMPGPTIIHDRATVSIPDLPSGSGQIAMPGPPSGFPSPPAPPGPPSAVLSAPGHPAEVRHPLQQQDQNRIHQAVKRLTEAEDGEEKQQARQALRNVLTSIFDQDMSSRERQAQEIESRVRTLRKQYEQRENQKEQVIDLWMQVLENSASGLEFPGGPSQFTRILPPAGQITPYPGNANRHRSEANRDRSESDPYGPGTTVTTNVPTTIELGNLLTEFDELRTQFLNGKTKMQQAQAALEVLKASQQGGNSQRNAEESARRHQSALMELAQATARWEGLQQQLRAIQRVLAVDLERQQVALQSAQERLARLQELYEAKTISSSELEEQKAAVKDAALRVKRAEELYELYRNLDAQGSESAVPPGLDEPDQRTDSDTSGSPAADSDAAQ